ncbi:hypothetical protein AMECASPLE_011238 [Ameca splendens]|uniref:Uncharacterized protein n=1 Tax=Ameca splendens TaxID=208324 RepID=A0ABV0YBW9_9TELE
MCVVMEFKQKFNMEDLDLVQSLLTGCSNQRQVRTPPQPIISQGITFKDLLHEKHHSSAEPTPPPGSDPRGEDVPNHNHKMFIQTYFILSVYVFLRGPSAEEIIFH